MAAMELALSWRPANTITGKPRKEDDPQREPIRQMERQYEWPLSARINRRKPLFLDQLPARQFESPLEALVNSRSQQTLDQMPGQLESPLYALTNQREPQPIQELDHQQFESPLNAVVNQHEDLRRWRSPNRFHPLQNGM